MIGNAVTFHQIDALDQYTDNLILQNGGAYGYANGSAHVGVYVGMAAGALYAAAAAGLTSPGTITMTEMYGQTHFMAQVEGVWYHAVGRVGSMRIIGAAVYESPAVGWWTSITVPLLNAGAVSGYIANNPLTTNCLTGAIQVLWNGMW
jgi:hypothetical protein